MQNNSYRKNKEKYGNGLLSSLNNYISGYRGKIISGLGAIALGLTCSGCETSNIRNIGNLFSYESGITPYSIQSDGPSGIGGGDGGEGASIGGSGSGAGSGGTGGGSGNGPGPSGPSGGGGGIGGNGTGPSGSGPGPSGPGR